MTGTYFRRRRYATPQKDTFADAKISRLFNELRHELLDHRAKIIDWWLSATAIFLTLLGIVAVIAGYLSFKRFSEIEIEARRNVELSREHAEEAQTLVGEIKKKRNEAINLTAETVGKDPDEAHKVAKNVQENPLSSSISRAVADAVLLQRQGKIEEAIEKWRAVANVVDGIDKKTGARAWFSIAYLLRKNERNNLEAVIDAYDEAIRLNPGYAKAYNNRGIEKESLGRYEEAISDFNKAIRLNPDYAKPYYNRGNAKESLGRYEEAISDYDKAIRLNPDYVKAYNNRGIAKGTLGRNVEAISDFNEAIRLNPDYAKAYYNRGKTNSFLNRMDEARRDFETAITLARDTGDETLTSNAKHALKELSGEQDQSR